MKPLCSALAVLMLIACFAVPALAAGSSGGQVFTWVDKHGVRHYSDHPANPEATPTNIYANQTGNESRDSKTAAPAAATGSSGHPTEAASSASATQPAMAAEQRAKLCATLRDQVKRIESARRVKVNKDGKSHYVSGEDLVELRDELQKKMHRVCKQSNQ